MLSTWSVFSVQQACRVDKNNCPDFYNSALIQILSQSHQKQPEIVVVDSCSLYLD